MLLILQLLMFAPISPPSSRLTADDLHHMLVLSRLLSLSEGRRTLTAETWQRVKRMEKERIERMAHLPPRQQQQQQQHHHQQQQQQAAHNVNNGRG